MRSAAVLRPTDVLENQLEGCCSGEERFHFFASCNHRLHGKKMNSLSPLISKGVRLDG
uniref:Uncharacterized protein n=1 Tax=Arundo donax TaxID=35708 RepID=A0A0A8ZSH1_ARUDO